MNKKRSVRPGGWLLTAGLTLTIGGALALAWAFMGEQVLELVEIAMKLVVIP